MNRVSRHRLRAGWYRFQWRKFLPSAPALASQIKLKLPVPEPGMKNDHDE